jgi:hypothetical protein
LNYKLSEKEKNFCHLYLQNGLNLRQAYIEAGYNWKSKSGNEYKLLKSDRIQLYMSDLLKDMRQCQIVPPELVIAELGKIAFGDDVDNAEIKSFMYKGEIIDKRYKTTNKDRLKALEILSKIYRLGDNKVIDENNLDNEININIKVNKDG